MLCFLPMRNKINMPTTSPELCFLLACIRADAPGGSADAWGTGMDWDRFVTLCRHHRCVPLVYRHLQRQEAGGVSTVPPAVMAALKKQTIKIAVCNVRMTEALCRIQALLAQDGIRVSCIKGPALSLLAYADTTTRPFGDLDLIVAEKDLARTVDLVLGQGYELHDMATRTNIRAFLQTRQGVTFRNKPRTIYLDLNSAVISHLFSPPALTDHILAASRPIAIDEQRHIDSPGPALMMMVVCMHGAHDMWNKLFTVADVAALLQAHPAADWAGLLATAAAWGQKRAVLVGMETARRLLGVRLPDAIAHAIEADAASVTLADAAVRLILSGNSLNVSLWRQKRFEFRSRDNLGARFRWLLRLAFVPGSSEFNLIAVPPRLAFIYYLLRPFRLLATAFNKAQPPPF